MRQAPLQRLVRAIEARRNGTHRAAQHFGDFLIRQALRVAQHNDDALLGGQLFHGALNAAAREFGSLGVAFAYISWLFVLAFAVVLFTIMGAVLVRDDGWFGRLLRGSTPLPERVGDVS